MSSSLTGRRTTNQTKKSKRRATHGKRRWLRAGMRVEALEPRTLLTALGPEFRINETTGGDQHSVALGSDASGNFVAVWQGPNQNGYGSSDVFFQRLNSMGTPLGPETQVPEAWPGEQTAPDVAVRPDTGSFVVTFQAPDADGTGIYLRRFDGSGTPLGDSQLVNATTTGEQVAPAIAMEDNGDFVIVWQSPDTSGQGVFGQRFAADGTAIGSPFQVNTTPDNDQSGPAVAMDPDGDFVVAWHSLYQDGSGWGVFAQRYDNAGNAAGTEFQVNTTPGNDQAGPAVAMDADGDFVVTWHSWYQPGDNDGWGVVAQRYSADGTAAGGEFLVNTSTGWHQDTADVVMAADGGFLVTWEGGDGDNYGIYYRRFDAAGNEVELETLVNTTTKWYQQSPAVALGSGDHFLIGWQSVNENGNWSWGIFAQLYGTDLGQVDLVPLSTTAPNGLNQGADFTATATFRNQGRQVALAPFGVQYYLSTDPIITAADTPIGAEVSVLGESSITTPLTIAVDQTPGKYYLGVLLDTGDTNHEADETNNGTATVAFAQLDIRPAPTPFGGEFRVNTSAWSDQHSVAVDADASGNYVVVWQGPNAQGYGTSDVFFQRYNAAGTPLGPERRANADWHGEQTQPDVAVADDGTFVVTWTSPEADSTGVFGQRFAANGAPLGNVFQVNATPDGNQSDAQVAIDKDTGNFAVVWTSEGQDGSSWGVYGQRYLANGTASGGEFRVTTQTSDDQSNPSVAMDANGNFVVGWRSHNQDGSSWGVFAQRYAADGTALGSEFQVNSYTYSEQRDPSVAVSSTGEFVIAWHSNPQDGSEWGVYAQRYAADGTPQGGEFRVNTYRDRSQEDPAVGFDAAGNFTILWMSVYQDGSEWGVFGQRYAADGSPWGGEFLVNTRTYHHQYLPAIVFGAGGEFLAAWQSYDQDGSGWGIYGQLYGEGFAQADLVPLSTTAPLGLHPGDPFSVTAEFRNQGAADAGTFVARYYLSTDAIITDTDTPIGGAFPVAGVSALSGLSDSRSLDIPGGMPVGTYYLGILLDTSSEIDEADEGNNGTATRGFAQIVIAEPPPKLDGQFRVNRSAGGDQGSIRVAGNSHDQFVAVWQGPNTRGYGTTDVLFQRLNAYDTPLGPETTVHNDWRQDQLDPDVAVAEDGTFVVVYDSPDASGRGVYLRRFDAEGAPFGDPLLVNSVTDNDQVNPSIAMDAAGNFVVVWQSWEQGSDSQWGVFGQRFNAAGQKVGAAFHVNTYTSSEQRNPRVAMDDAGDFVVTWNSYSADGSDWAVSGQRYKADGTAAGSEFQANTFTNSTQSSPSVAMDAAGNFVVIWTSWQYDAYDIWGQRFANDGSRAGGEFLVNTTTGSHQEMPAVIMDGTGNFIVAWADEGGRDGSGWGVFAQRYDATGTVVGGEFRVNTETDNSQYVPALAFGGGGRFLAVWQGWTPSTWTWDVFGQIYGSGLAQPDLVPMLTTAPAGANQNAIITVSAELRNQGTAVTDSFTARYYLSDDATITTADTPLGSPFTVDGIGALTTITDSHELQMPADAPQGRKYLGLLVDLGGSVTEQDEGNNGTAAIGFATLYIAPPPPPLGAEFQINSSTGGDQGNNEVGADANGNYVVVWHGPNRNGYGGTDVYAQRYNALGTPIGPEFQVNPDWHGEQTCPDIAVAPDGSFVVTYQSDSGADGDQTGIYARRFAADGQALGDQFLVNTYPTNRQEGPAIAMDSTGKFVIAWHSLVQDASSWGVYAQRFDAAGNPVDTEFRVNSYSDNEQSTPDVAMDATGNFVIVWHSLYQDGSEYGVFGQRYSAAGVPRGVEFQVNTYTSSWQTSPSVAVDASGNFVVVWRSWGQDGSNAATYAQRYDNNGNQVGGEFLVNTYTYDSQEYAKVAMGATGNFVIAWNSSGQDGSGQGVYVQRYDSAGHPQGGEFRANSYTYSEQSSAAVACGSGDRFLVTWASNHDGSGWGVYGQLYGTGVPQADLIPIAASTAPGWNLNQGMQVHSVIRNQGLADAGPFTGQYYLSTDTTITAADTPLGAPFQIPGLTTMKTMMDDRWVAVPDVPAGNYYVGLMVDTDNTLAEQDETNNTYQPLFADRPTNLGPLPALGPEQRVNEWVQSDQVSPQVAFDAAGNYVVVWQSWQQDGSGWGIYGQHYDPTGEPIGSEFRVNRTVDNDQVSPSVAAASDGSFVVAWASAGQDGDGWGVFAQRFDTIGELVGDEFQVNTYATNTQDTPSLVMDGTGRFLIVWHSVGQDSGNNGGIYGQFYNANGTPNGDEFWVTSSSAPNQMRPKAAMNASGQFVVAWDDDYTVWARAFLADGTARGDEFVVHDYNADYQQLPSVGIDNTGNFVVAWQSYRADTGNWDDWSVRARRFAADGTPLADEFGVNTYTPGEQSAPSVSMNGAGQFIVAWQSRYEDGSEYGIYGQRFNADGSRNGGEFQVNVQTGNWQNNPAVAIRDLSEFVVVWQSAGNDGSGWGIFSQRAGLTNENSLPNLVVSQNAAPSPIDLGQPVDVTLTVTNTGLAVSSPTKVKLFLSDDDVAGNADDIDLNLAVDVPQLLNGFGHNSFQTTVRFTWPARDPFGTDRYYTVAAVADADNQVAESNENDNASISNWMWLRMANLWVYELSVPRTVQPGQQVEVAIGVYNGGDAPAVPSIAHLWFSDDNVAGNEDDQNLYLDVNIPALQPWEQYTTTVTFNFPTSLPSADRYYHVVAQVDVEDKVVESDENNWGVSNSMFVNLPDLAFEQLSVPGSVSAAETFDASVLIRNYGQLASGVSTVHFWLSDDDVLGNEDDVALPGVIDVPALDPYGWPDYRQFSGAVSVTWPADVPFGTDRTAYLVARIDPVPLETEFGNNGGVSNSIHQRMPDLAAMNVQGPNQVRPGSDVTYDFRIRDVGDGSSPPSTAKVMLSPDPVPDNGDEIDLGIVPVDVPPLDAGGIYVASVTFTWPEVDPFGTYYLIVQADTADVVHESDETNNWGVSFPITLLFPDLAAQSARIPSTVSAGLNLNALVRARNLGTDVSQATQGHVFLSDNAVAGDADDLDLGVPFDVPLLNVGAVAELSLQVPMPATDPFPGSDGEYHLVFALDAAPEDPQAANNVLVSAPFTWVVPSPMTLDVVGHLGGSSLAVTTQGDYAYELTSAGFRVLDVSDPSAMVKVGELVFPVVTSASVPQFGVSCGEVIADGSLVLVADALSLQFIDVSLPALPTRVWSLAPEEDAEAGPISGVSLNPDSKLIYVARGSELMILDYQDPIAVQEIGSFELPGQTLGLAVQDNVAYTIYAAPDFNGVGLETVSIADPTAPAFLGRRLEAGQLLHPVIHGNVLAVAASNYYYWDSDRGVRLFDISTPDMPRARGMYRLNENVIDLAFRGDDLVVAFSGSVGMLVLDVADPFDPAAIASTVIQSQYAYEGGLWIDDHNMAYAAVGDLVAVDLTDRYEPEVAGLFGEPRDLAEVAASQNIATMTNGASLWMADVSQPALPMLLGQVVYAGGVYGLNQSGTLAVVNAYSSITFFDLTDPSCPAKGGSLDVSYVRDVALDGNLAYVLVQEYNYYYYQYLVKVVDATDPASPQLAGEVAVLTFGAPAIAVANGYVYVTDAYSSDNVTVVDARDPAHPLLVGQFNTEQPVRDLAAAGTHLYVVVDQPPMLQVWDVSDGAAPQLRGTAQLEAVGPLAVDGGLAVVQSPALPDQNLPGFQFIDVADADRPVMLGTLYPDLGFPIQDWAFAGGILHVAAGGTYFTLAAQTTGEKFPDLAVTSLAIPAAAQIGKPLNIDWTVRNHGKEVAGQPWTDAVYLSTDARLDPDTDRLLGEVPQTADLDPLATYDAQLAADTAGLAPGLYYVIVKTDNADQVNEAFVESNNLRVSALPVLLGYPDLTVKSVITPRFVVPGEPLPVSWTVQNVSDAPAGDPTWTDSIYLSLTGQLDGSEIPVDEPVEHAGGLGPQQSYQGTVTIDSSLVQDGMVVIIVTDSGGAVDENGSEGNNTGVSAPPLTTGYPDLQVTHVAAPISVERGQPLDVSWIVHNRGEAPARSAAGWTDNVYLSLTPTLDPASTPVASLPHGEELPIGAVYGAATAIDTSGIAQGDYFVFVRSDADDAVFENGREENNVPRSGALVRLGVPELTLGVSYPDQFAFNGQSKFYRVTVDAGQNLFVSLDDLNDTGFNEVYIKYGSAPSRSDYDARCFGLTGDQVVQIPDTQAGEYFVLVYARSAPDLPDANFNLTAAVLDFEFLGLSPNTAGNTGPVTVRFRGAGFDTATTVAFVGPDGATPLAVIQPISVAFVNSTELWGTFDLAGATVGDYDLRFVQGPDIPVVKENVFHVVEGGGPDLLADIQVAGAIRAGQAGRMVVEVVNVGNSDAYTPVVWLDPPSGMAVTLDPAAPYQDVNEILLDLSLPGCPFPVIPPGESVRVPVYFRAPMTPGPTHIGLEAYFVTPISVVSAQEGTLASNGVTDLGAVGETQWTERGGAERYQLTAVGPGTRDMATDAFQTLLQQFDGGWTVNATISGLGDATYQLLGKDQPGFRLVGARLDIPTEAGWVQTLDQRLDSKFVKWNTQRVDFLGSHTDLFTGQETSQDDAYPFYYDAVDGAMPVQAFADVPTCPYRVLAWMAANSGKLANGKRTATFRTSYDVHKVEWNAAPTQSLVVGEGVNWGYSLNATVEPDRRVIKPITIVRAWDPNDKTGPGGFGDAHFITPDLSMLFTVFYENDPVHGATAPAQVVRVEDTLDAGLDLSTFELGDINLYNGYWVDVPAGLNFYETTVDLRDAAENPQNLLVHVIAELDTDTRMATWTFESLDPETLQAPEDALTGFLAVNNKELHDGEGKLLYTVRPLADLTTGTRITNQAFNYFDTNEAVPTPTTLHTIDAGAPASAVNALPNSVPDDPFEVSWTGADDNGGSGIASYTVYVAMDGGAWDVWQKDTTATSAMFTPVGGHHYDFYSVATDNVAHVEPQAAVADTGTTVDYSTLRVDLLEAVPGGFAVHFRRPLDASVLNLYDSQRQPAGATNLGASDMTVVGQTTGPVPGSLVYDADTKTVQFIRTGGRLAPDTYTITLRSAEDAFKDTEGKLLDGDADGQDGGDYATTFTIQASSAPVISLPDFVGGPGQEASWAGTTAIPVMISEGTGVDAIDLTFTYDPSVLSITAVALGAGMPQNSLVQANLTTPGVVVLGVLAPDGLPAGQVEIVRLTGTIAAEADYGRQQMLDITRVSINEGHLAGDADNALFATTMLGDTTGDGTYSALDAQRALRVAVGLDTGFAALPMVDPVVIADVTGNGTISSLDAVQILRLAVGLPLLPQQPLASRTAPAAPLAAADGAAVAPQIATAAADQPPASEPLPGEGEAPSLGSGGPAAAVPAAAQASTIVWACAASAAGVQRSLANTPVQDGVLPVRDDDVVQTNAAFASTAMDLPPAAQQGRALLAPAAQSLSPAAGNADGAPDVTPYTAPAASHVDRVWAADRGRLAATALEEPLLDSLVEAAPLEVNGVDEVFRALGRG